jgi:hypothetical protein
MKLGSLPKFLRLFPVLAILASCSSSPPTEVQHGRMKLGKATTYQTDVLSLALNATPIANIADNTATSPLTNLYIAFHTADPANTGNQSTSEATFTGYARTAIARSNGAPQWTVSSIANLGTAKNTNAITGPTYTVGAGSSQTLTNFTIGTLVSGTGKILYDGSLTNSLVMNPGETINIAANALVITED